MQLGGDFPAAQLLKGDVLTVVLVKIHEKFDQMKLAGYNIIAIVHALMCTVKCLFEYFV